MLDYFKKVIYPSPGTCTDNKIFSKESISLLHYYLLIEKMQSLECLLDQLHEKCPGLDIQGAAAPLPGESRKRIPSSPAIQESPVWYNIAFLSQRSHDTKRQLIQSLKMHTRHFIVVLHLYCSVPFRGERRYSNAKNRSKNLTE